MSACRRFADRCSACSIDRCSACFATSLLQQQFIDEVLSTELMLYVAPAWLAEVFQRIIHVSLLEHAGYRDMGRDDADECPLVQLLIGENVLLCSCLLVEMCPYVAAQW